MLGARHRPQTKHCLYVCQEGIILKEIAPCHALEWKSADCVIGSASKLSCGQQDRKSGDSSVKPLSCRLLELLPNSWDSVKLLKMPMIIIEPCLLGFWDCILNSRCRWLPYRRTLNSFFWFKRGACIWHLQEKEKRIQACEVGWGWILPAEDGPESDAGSGDAELLRDLDVIDVGCEGHLECDMRRVVPVLWRSLEGPHLTRLQDGLPGKQYSM